MDKEDRFVIHLLKDKYRLTEAQFQELRFHHKSGQARSSDLRREGLKLRQIEKDLEDIKKGVPLAYVIGYVDFLNCHIDLAEKPLVPRPETEYWVAGLLDEIKESTRNNLRVLDIFCGSGCIGISLLKSLSHVSVTFADVSDSALFQTEINLKINNVKKSGYNIIKSDIFRNIDSEFDLISANPPYVGTEDNFDKDIKYEPKEALFAGREGLNIIEPFLKQAGKYLSDDGIIYLEFGGNQKDKIDMILKGCRYSRWQFYKDQFGKWRYVCVRL